VQYGFYPPQSLLNMCDVARPNADVMFYSITFTSSHFLFVVPMLTEFIGWLEQLQKHSHRHQRAILLFPQSLIHGIQGLWLFEM
jgi:hypothetical protein